jgi:hypothetical protein
MDSTLILAALDRIREEQFHQAGLMRTVMSRQASIIDQLKVRHTSPDSSQPQNWKKLLVPIARSAAQAGAQWAAGILAISYTLKGGDLLTALETLAKLFG